jgi:hypothetical protein
MPGKDFLGSDVRFDSLEFTMWVCAGLFEQSEEYRSVAVSTLLHLSRVFRAIRQVPAVSCADLGSPDVRTARART